MVSWYASRLQDITVTSLPAGEQWRLLTATDQDKIVSAWTLPFWRSQSSVWTVSSHTKRCREISMRMSRLIAVGFVACILSLCSIQRAAAQLNTPWFVHKWGQCCNGEGRFFNPRGVAIDAAGYVYVADTFNNRIQKFDRTGTFVVAWGTNGNGRREFSYPTGVAVDGSGHVYVADTFNNRVQKFDKTGEFLTAWGTSGSEVTQLQQPHGIAIGPNGDVLVADTANDRIQKFSNTGTFLSAWGVRGDGDGQFNSPQGVAVDAMGNVFVADTGNDRIQKFDSTGIFLVAWGSKGNGDGEFVSPFGVAVDASGNVFTSDTLNDRIQKFGNDGSFLTTWGSDGSGDAQFQSPQGVAIDAAGNVYVVDQKSNNRIQKFAPSLAGLVAGLSQQVRSLEHLLSTENGHSSAVDTALARSSDNNAMEQGSNASAIDALLTFIDVVETQRGLRLADVQADFLVAAAEAMVASLGG